MTKAVSDDNDAKSMVTSLQEVVSLFEAAQNSVFKLMSSVSFFVIQSLVTTLFINNGFCRTRCPNSSVNQNTHTLCKNTISILILGHALPAPLPHPQRQYPPLLSLNGRVADL